MRGAVMQLARWGAARPRLSPPARRRCARTRFVYGAERIAVDIKPRHGVDALYAPRRTVLDPMLAARRAPRPAPTSATARAFDACCAPAAAGWSARRCRTADGAACRCAAGIVIGADGRRSTRRAPRSRRRCATRGAPRRRQRLRLRRRPRGPRLPLALRARRRRRRDPDQRRAALRLRLACRRRASAPRRAATARRAGARAGARSHRASPPRSRAGRLVATARRLRRRAAASCAAPHGPGWALVGDAGYFKDPITAHGITDALRDAEILARAVSPAPTPALGRYQATRDALSLPLFEATDAIAALDWSLPAQALHKALTRR